MEDALADPEYDRRHAEVGGWRRMLSVPLLREGVPIGAIVVRDGVVLVLLIVLMVTSSYLVNKSINVELPKAATGETASAVRSTRLHMGLKARPTRRGGNRARGFTLVDVLVTLAVITILIGILLPALGTARASARSSASYGMLMSGKRGPSRSSFSPRRGLSGNMLMWSVMTIRVPGSWPMPPAALVMMKVLTPRVMSVRSGNTRVRASCPS